MFGSREWLDQLFLNEARRVQRQSESIQCSNVSGTWTDLLFRNTTDYTANANSTGATSMLLGGGTEAPQFRAFFFTQPQGRAVRLWGNGVIGSAAGTATIIFQFQLSSTQSFSATNGTNIAVSATLTPPTNATPVQWSFVLDLICTSPGYGSTNTTLQAVGYVESPSGFATPFKFPLQPTTPPTSTWTVGIDGSLTQFLYFNTNWSAANASNTITLKQLFAAGLN